MIPCRSQRTSSYKPVKLITCFRQRPCRLLWAILRRDRNALGNPVRNGQIRRPPPFGVIAIVSPLFFTDMSITQPIQNQFRVLSRRDIAAGHQILIQTPQFFKQVGQCLHITVGRQILIQTPLVSSRWGCIKMKSGTRPQSSRHAMNWPPSELSTFTRSRLADSNTLLRVACTLLLPLTTQIAMTIRVISRVRYRLLEIIIRFDSRNPQEPAESVLGNVHHHAFRPQVFPSCILEV
jgi:hypothetical protein